jgi:hypothetical protein
MVKTEEDEDDSTRINKKICEEIEEQRRNLQQRSMKIEEN